MPQPASRCLLILRPRVSFSSICTCIASSGLQPGVYRLWPERAELEQIKSGDQRVAAAGLSLGQDLAGNACVAFSMIGDLDRAARSLW